MMSVIEMLRVGFNEDYYSDFRSLGMCANERVVCSVTLGNGSGNARAWAASSSLVACSFARIATGLF